MIEVKAADIRRAAALIVHYGHQDDAGMDAILQEANEPNRIAELILATIRVYETLIPLLHTEAGLALLRRTITDMAVREEHDAQNDNDDPEDERQQP